MRRKVGVSLREFAKRVGCTHQAVSKGLRSGRLERSVRWHRGRPVIVDAELAEREWVDSYDPMKDARAWDR